MSETINLGGQWELTGSDATGQREPVTVEALVPGHVHHDLQLGGIIADPRVGYNAEECQWIESMQWKYKKTFELERIPEGYPVLHFEGVDTYAAIYLNGIRLGRTDNMFVNYRFEVAGVLRTGRNELEVVFSTVDEALKGKPYGNYEAAFTNERVYVRRMQCTFGWDWVNRFVSYGIWRPVRLAFEPAATIADVYVYTQSLDASGAAIRYCLEVGRRLSEPLRAEATMRDPRGNVVWQADKPIFGDKLELTASLREPELWWPAGYGDQPLYTVETTIRTASGRALQTRVVQFGVRTVRIQQLQDAPGSREAEMTTRLREQFSLWDHNGDRPGSSFSLLVNGREIYCNGANWVPVDPFPSRVDEKHYAHLLRLARDSHFTMIRCWGGGIIEPEIFWSECDRLGLLVSQDFLMACGKYPEDDEEWTRSLRAEAETGIRALRNHPSLVWWNGDNENAMFYDEENPAYPGRKVAETITGRLCAELDPSRPFMPSSPFGGSPNLSFTVGTSHVTGIMLEMIEYLRTHDMDDYRDYFSSFISRFCPEFPMFGTPEIHSMRRFMSEEQLQDPTFKMIEYHTKNHPGLTDFSLFKALELLGEKLTPSTDNIVERIRRMSFVQRELTQIVVESYRRNRFYTGGLLFWMYNDCWSASGWSLVDYYGYPKGGYYGIKAASKPVIASVERDRTNGSILCWVCNERLEQSNGIGRLFVLSLDAEATDKAMWSSEFEFAVAPGSSAAAATFDDAELRSYLDNRHVLVMEIEGAFGTDRSVWFTGRPAELQLAPSEARIAKRTDAEGGGTLIVTANRYAHSVMLHGEYVFSDNYFELLPGESKTVPYYSIAGAQEKREIELHAWN
ncbi:beta-mannosidase [Paenibacillus agaridevorans]|uniref:beta-mannosidase n=1 Tax=Paenibacillus agaridevorans TaxID=171404 RepID=A0A2R5EGV6_9BACL|nr:glycoside hydrolase family 2 protein [Paenibacillus agaridevorans]GBG05802.1 beta-mannosidase [Paenibacillus agaridevorans]